MRRKSWNKNSESRTLKLTRFVLLSDLLSDCLLTCFRLILFRETIFILRKIANDDLVCLADYYISFVIQIHFRIMRMSKNSLICFVVFSTVLSSMATVRPILNLLFQCSCPRSVVSLFFVFLSLLFTRLNKVSKRN